MFSMAKPLLAGSIIVMLAGCSDRTIDPVVNKPQIYSDYSDASFVAQPDFLSDHLDDPDLLIIDARGTQYADSLHIPGAVAVKWQQFASVGTGVPGDPGWGVVLSPADLSPKLDSLGVTTSKEIVVYSCNNAGWGEDGRIVWMLRMAGLTQAKILNGGWTYWENGGYPTTAAKTAASVPSGFTVEFYDSSYTATKSYIAANLSTIHLIDTRAGTEYNGAINYGEKRGGHLPGAILLTFTDVFQSNGLLIGQRDLESRFYSAGLVKSGEIIAYCTKGIRSGHLAIVLRAAGYSQARNYDASFYEWAGDSTLSVE